jgi:hypothetical protein
MAGKAAFKSARMAGESFCGIAQLEIGQHGGGERGTDGGLVPGADGGCVAARQVSSSMTR